VFTGATEDREEEGDGKEEIVRAFRVKDCEET